MENHAYTLSDANAGIPLFTLWVVDQGFLTEPFVHIDIGVNGGFHPRWRCLGDSLHAIGFDPVPSVIETLATSSNFPGRTEYRCEAVGEIDGEETFYIIPENTTQSSFFGGGNDAGSQVNVRSLDSLFQSKEIPLADFIKIDCEGLDPIILRGAKEFIKKCRFIGIQSEASFRSSVTLPDGHFGEILNFCTQNYLELYSMIHDRYLLPGYVESAAIPRDRLKDASRFGRIGTSDALFVADIVTQRDSSDTYDKLDANGELVKFSYAPPTTEQILKMGIIFELYGLRDCALDLMTKAEDELGNRVDLDKAKSLLAVSPNIL